MKKINKIFISVMFAIIFMTFMLYGCKDEKQQSTKTIIDMAGRSVEINDTKIEKIYCTDPVSAITVYTINPELLLGWNYKFNDYEKEYILPQYRDLNVFGMGDKVNIEAIISNSPDIAIQMGATNDKAVENANKLSKQLNIPVIIVDGSLLNLPQSYDFIGSIIGDNKRTEILSKYSKNIIDTVLEFSDDIENKRTIYYGNGFDSLETAPVGSSASEVFEILGAKNIIDSGFNPDSTTQRIQISQEQLITLNPQYIFVNGEPKENITGSDAVYQIMDNPNYLNIDAVKNNNVYSIPKAPFSWIDRPKGPNRLIGIAWASSIIYPEIYGNLENSLVKDFYKTFYHIDITDEQVNELLYP